VTLYWLGRLAQAMGFRGPQLNLTAFVALACSKCKMPISRDDRYVVTLDKQVRSRALSLPPSQSLEADDSSFNFGGGH